MSEQILAVYNKVTNVPTMYDGAYHITLVYINNRGQSFYTSAGPTIPASPDASTSLGASKDAVEGRATAYGVLGYKTEQFDINDPSNPTMIDKDSGIPYQTKILSQGTNLSSQWNTILETYHSISTLGVPYSPGWQNSNSVAGTALRKAGISIPFDSSSKWAPGLLLQLPTTNSEFIKFNGNQTLNQFNNNDGTVTTVIDTASAGQQEKIEIVSANNIIISLTDYSNMNGIFNIHHSGKNKEILASNSHIYAFKDSSLNVFGHGNTINLEKNANIYAGIFGQAVVNGISASNSINVGGEGTSITAYGSDGVGGYVGLIASRQSLTLGNWGFSVATAPN
ncbi:hypothetical protein E4V01_25105, partial [Methylorubrum sp. Q1]|uniref:hypothetical protein n=1 Tax=Methylorubrum sp. Q1 TaxID=2562453 RepID=UPI001076915C